MASLAQLEGRIIADRLHKGRRRKAARGGYVGGWLPYGYRAEGGEVVAVASEVGIVRHVFELRASGLGYGEIARRLAAERVPTRRGGRWAVSNVRRILRNRFYLGESACGGPPVPGRHEAVVSPDLFERASARAAGPRR
jgi:site-specific DNA recombinase